MGVTNLGRVQGGGFYYADYTPSDAESSIRLGRVWLKPNTVKALIGDHVVMADGSLWEITAFSDGEADLVMALERKTSIRGKTGAQGEAGIGCSVNGEPTALDFTSDPQSQIDVLKKLYDVGSIYMSTNSTSPASLFGGEWVQITDRFLLGASSITLGANATYKVSTAGTNTDGGEATHTLTINEMPSHTHKQSGGSSGVNDDGNLIQRGYSTPLKAVADAGKTGGGQAHNNMPPYHIVYIWQRTA